MINKKELLTQIAHMIKLETSNKIFVLNNKIKLLLPNKKFINITLKKI